MVIPEAWSSLQPAKAHRREPMERAPPLPASPRKGHDLTELFTLRKALHEMSFELGNRPVWAAIPVDGVIELRDAAG